MNPRHNTLFNKIKRLTGQAIGDFRLIDDGDHIAVAVSGGKDSYILLHMLEALRRRAPVSFRLTAVNIDPGYPGYRTDCIEEHLRRHGFAGHMVAAGYYRIVRERITPGTSFCAFCARMRRGVLYTEASRLGCNKIALGHHLDDCIETLLLNQFFAGRLAAMSPAMRADNGEHTVIRPLVYVLEEDLACLARAMQVPVISCACPECGRGDLQRRQMKRLLADLEKDTPGIKRSLLAAAGNVQPRHLLDRSLKRTDENG
jgi:tRNA 2-thiocytidine biosynthesis protein TtcA